MKRFSRILVALDGSEDSMRAADLAISIATKNDSELIALYVFYSLIGYAYTSYMSKLENSPSIDAILDATEKEASQWFNAIKDKTAGRDGKRYNIRFEGKIITTSTSIPAAITGYASKNAMNLIVIGTKGRTGIKRKLLGSVTQEVIRDSHCPVLVTR